MFRKNNVTISWHNTYRQQLSRIQPAAQNGSVTVPTCKRSRVSALLQVSKVMYCTVDTVAGLCDNVNVSESCTGGPQRLPDRSSCNHYYQCQGGTYRRQQCTTPTIEYDIDTMVCVPAGTVDCSYRCKTPAPMTEPQWTSITTQTDLTSTSSSFSNTTTTISGVLAGYSFQITDHNHNRDVQHSC